LDITIDSDAFSNGQIDSKIWLCEELEKLFDRIDNVAIYGGWYGLTSFILKIRNNIEIQTIKSFDVDEASCKIADVINENWVYKTWQFKAFTEDCNRLSLENIDLVINTSTEHFDEITWFENIPKGTVVALQSNNMPHLDHINCTDNLQDFEKRYCLTKMLYKGEKKFEYPTWEFTRYMLIGIK
jgi:hypothetical protein